MRPARDHGLPRQRQPELEHDHARPTSLGYEAVEDGRGPLPGARLSDASGALAFP